MIIAGKSAPIHIIVHYPETIEGQHELAERAAEVHADLVNQSIKKLNCSSSQKLQLLDAVIKSVSAEKADILPHSDTGFLP